MKRAARGFSLIELMVVVAIAGIVTAIALPRYNESVTRTRSNEAFGVLQSAQLAAEEFWSINRTYAAFDRLPAATDNFTFTLSGATASAYLVTATGRNKMAGFAYTINQNGDRRTTAVPSGWTLTATCWVDQKAGTCTQ